MSLNVYAHLVCIFLSLNAEMFVGGCSSLNRLFYNLTGVQLFPRIRLASLASLILVEELVFVVIGYWAQA